MVENKFMGISC